MKTTSYILIAAAAFVAMGIVGRLLGPEAAAAVFTIAGLVGGVVVAGR